MIDPTLELQFRERKKAVEKTGTRILQRDGELLELCCLLRRFSIRNIVEIGFAEGGSAAMLMHLLPEAKRLWVYEPFEAGAPVTQVMNFNTECGRKMLDQLRVEGYEVELNPSADPPKASVDFLHIDGDHRRPRQDWDRFHTAVKPGGFVAIHDIVSKEMPSPGILFEELARTRQSWRFIDATHWLGIGVLRL